MAPRRVRRYTGRMTYAATLDSLRQHPVPDWFRDAKLGIFVHWGAYSVPGWAARSEGSQFEQAAAKGWEYAFAHNPYAEWYLNSLSIEGSPTREHHVATYGEGFSYDEFGPMFNAAMRGWDPDAWASLFAASGARYVVPGAKHHDGFLMWASDDGRTARLRRPARLAPRRRRRRHRSAGGAGAVARMLAAALAGSHRLNAGTHCSGCRVLHSDHDVAPATIRAPHG